MNQLFNELKRRNVFRVGITYLVASWLVLQVADLVLDSIAAPAWVMLAFLLVFGLGLLITLIFAWAYELTPEGLKKEKDVDRSSSVTHTTGKKLNQVTIALLVSVIVVLVAERMFFSAPPAAAPTTAAISNAAPEKSIAVLAFEDLSPDGDQAYFAEGLSEELLNVLAQIPDLKVAGRTSSFAFKGQNKDLREIGDILNVAHILEGSVRKSGNQIRVTAQLINTADGYHLFSETYDRNLTDVFAVQDELAARISTALQSKLVGSDDVRQATPTNIEAYELYLAARQDIHTRDAVRMAEASRKLDQALVIDPLYSPALAQKALVTYLLSDSQGAYGDMPVAAALAISIPMVDKAIALDPNNAEAIAISGLLMRPEGVAASEQVAAAELRVSTLRHALELNPGLISAKIWLSQALSNIGRDEEAIALIESIVERDPAFPPVLSNLVGHYIATRNADKANALVGRVERIVGETSSVSQAWGLIALFDGDIADAIRYMRRSYAANPSNTVLKSIYGFALRSIGEFEQMLSIAPPRARVFAHRALGNDDLAQALLEQLQPILDTQSLLAITVAYHENRRNFEAIVSYADTSFPSIEALLKQFPRLTEYDTGYMGPLAYALLQTGRDDDFERVTNAMNVSIRSAHASGVHFFPLWYSEAEYAALTGSDEELFEKLQYIVDQNMVRALGFESSLFDRVADSDRFIAMNKILRKRSDEQRAKLGLEPYQPIMVTN